MDPGHAESVREATEDRQEVSAGVRLTRFGEKRDSRSFSESKVVGRFANVSSTRLVVVGVEVG